MCFYLYSSGNDLSAMCMLRTSATQASELEHRATMLFRFGKRASSEKIPPSSRVPLRPDRKGVSQGDHMVHSSPKRIACPLF